MCGVRPLITRTCWQPKCISKLGETFVSPTMYSSHRTWTFWIFLRFIFLPGVDGLHWYLDKPWPESYTPLVLLLRQSYLYSNAFWFIFLLFDMHAVYPGSWTVSARWGVFMNASLLQTKIPSALSCFGTGSASVWVPKPPQDHWCMRESKKSSQWFCFNVSLLWCHLGKVPPK